MVSRRPTSAARGATGVALQGDGKIVAVGVGVGPNEPTTSRSPALEADWPLWRLANNDARFVG